MKNQILIAVSVLAVIAVLIAIYFMWIKNDFWDSLKSKIKSGQEVVYFHELTPYEWDEVCVLGPYSLSGTSHYDEEGRKNHINSLIGKDVGVLAKDIPKEIDEGEWVFVFFRGDQAIGVEKDGIGFPVERKIKNHCLKKEEAIFKNGRHSIIISTTKE